MAAGTAAGTDCCVCSGTRSCLLCEHREKPTEDEINLSTITKYEFCLLCQKAVKFKNSCTHENNDGNAKMIDGLIVIENFLSEAEEKYIVHNIDKVAWKPSQSGRRKQDYGPQVNFKRKKVKLKYFNGLPAFSKFLIDRMRNEVSFLNDFKTVELCNLEYIPERGSSIDAHFDDFWLWGERLVTINLLSTAVITMSKKNVEIDVELPRRSLIIMSGQSRYQWKHGIKRQNIVSRRIAITLRELSSEFDEGGPKQALGNEIYDIAQTFCGNSVLENMVCDDENTELLK